MKNITFRITPPNPPNDGILFADLQKSDRSGHMGHALVEYAPGEILAFYPNCSSEDTRWNGHSGYGWMEYKRSIDGGETWSEPMIEPNSKALFDKGIGRTFMCEKAIKTDSGRIIFFYLNCDMITNGHIWEPYFEPYYAFSEDNGNSFSEAKQLFDQRGRVYDAIYHEGTIYVLFNADPELPGKAHNGDYDLLLYTSSDNGESFELRSKIGFTSTKHCFYGTMVFTPEHDLLVYTYDDQDEHNLKYIISKDRGFTWQNNRRAYFEKKLRNPQIVYYGNRYFIHGRGGHPKEFYGALVLYSSIDGINWDEGIYLRHKTASAGAYSNNLVVHCSDGRERLMIQSSHAYEACKTNVIMFFVDMA